eukprot:750846-Hanusia_phi.AAC.2
MATSLRAWATTLLLGVCWTTVGERCRKAENVKFGMLRRRMKESEVAGSNPEVELVAPVRRSGMTTGEMAKTVDMMLWLMREASRSSQWVKCLQARMPRSPLVPPRTCRFSSSSYSSCPRPRFPSPHDIEQIAPLSVMSAKKKPSKSKKSKG